MSHNCYYLLVVWVLIIWLLELNHGEGGVRVDVGVTVLGCMHLRHRLDLILDRFLNFGGVDVRLECRDVAGYNMQQ